MSPRSLFNAPAPRSVTVCGRNLANAAHICAFFESEAQEYDCLVPYFAQGLAQGEQVVTIRDAAECARHTQKLRARMPVPIDPAIRANQLRVVASEETYLKDGVFEQERMYNMLRQLLEDAEASPFRRVRTCGDMTWALRDMPGTDELMTYEARVNELTVEHDCTLMCFYDVNMFSGRMVMDVLATHPLVVMGDRIYENPYYQDPRQFLQSMLKRGSAPLARSPFATLG